MIYCIFILELNIFSSVVLISLIGLGLMYRLTLYLSAKTDGKFIASSGGAPHVISVLSDEKCACS